ncbi:MAG: hypothetical protein KF774_01790 [Planctomyces sp.]|nr:hypothetical protein [Planctomyces sp.]
MPIEPRTSGERAAPRLNESLRLLCICRDEPSWTALALQLDRLGCSEPRFRWCSNQTSGLTHLREESFDLVVIGAPAEDDTDPLVFLEVLREAGLDDPVLIISARADDPWLLRCGELDADVFPAAAEWDSRALAVWVQRVLARDDVQRDRLRLLHSERRQLAEGRDENDDALAQLQRVGRLATEAGDRPVPPVLRNAYAELLRNFVFFGGQWLDAEHSRLTAALVESRITARQAVRLHADCLQALLSGCGRRSSRHLRQNADIFALETVTRMAESYQQRSAGRGLGDHGIDLLSLNSCP